MRRPLVTLLADGGILRIEECSEPDRKALTEFYAGVLVPGFPADFRAVFERMRTQSGRPLPELLGELFSAPNADFFGEFPRSNPAFAAESSAADPGVLVVISGIDYDTMRLTAQSQIAKL